LSSTACATSSKNNDVIAEATGTIKKMDKNEIKKYDPQLIRSEIQRALPKNWKKADSSVM
jgi:hypothetical protein